MSKRIALVLAALLVAAALFAGGGQEGAAKATPSQYVLGTSGVGGSWYPTATKIATIINNDTPYKLIVQESGGGTENLRLLRSGEYKVAWAESNVLQYAYKGESLFAKDGPNKNLRYVHALYPSIFQSVVHADATDLQTLYDVKGHSVCPGSAGSGNEQGWVEILAVYGITPADTIWKPMQHTERAMAYKDRQIDLDGYQTSVPSGSIMEACAQTPLRLLPIEGKEREQLRKQSPWAIPWTIPANTYNGQIAAVETVGVYGTMVADASVTEDFIYQYLKAMYARLPEVQSVHGSAKYLTLEAALAGQGAVPLHPGAEKYFREAGLIK